MTVDTSRTRAKSAPSHRITWFAPDRPVENGTVYVRHEPAPEPDVNTEVTDG